MGRVIFAILLVLTQTARSQACEFALLLAVDVSGSVDREEYAIQMTGLAEGLNDPVVSETLVQARAKVAIVQWTGTSRQELSVPWTQVTSFSQVRALSDRVANLDRPWRNYATAIGEAQAFALHHLKDVRDCKRQVVDISGDGISNEGIEPTQMRDLFREANIQVNALAIEGAAEDLTGYYFENLISGPGAFVVTAQGYKDFPEKMRMKLRRETTMQLSDINLAPTEAQNIVSR